MNSPAPEFVSLNLDQIRSSPRNPRKTFDEEKLKQLAASITEKGVLEPILVRPRTLWQMVCGWVMGQKRMLDQDVSGYGLSKPQMERAGIAFKNGNQFDAIMKQLVTEGRAEHAKILNSSFDPGPNALDPVKDKDPLGFGIDHYQLVAGERRWRASALAGVETIPALVRDLDDHAAAEIAVIENDQREDVAPLEQAEGYARLIEMGDDVETIAAKIGRPAKYVAARLTLTKLIPSLQEDLRTGKLPFGHAHLLARLPAAEQEAVTGEEGIQLYEYDGAVAPLEYLKREIRREFIGLLNDAPWDRDDETMVPAAGACSKCMKRSGANPTLFDELVQDDTIDLNKKLKPKDLKPDHCTDRTCYSLKKTTFIELQVKKASEKSGTEAVKVSDMYYAQRDGVLGKDRYEVVKATEAKADPKCRPAVVVDGDDAGKTIYVREKKPSTGRSDPAWAKEEAKRREKAIAANRAALVANGKVATKATEVYNHGPDRTRLNILRQLAATIAREMWADATRIVAKRRELGDKEHRGLVEKTALDCASESEVFGLLAELVAARLSFSWGAAYQGQTMVQGEKDFWAAFDVDKQQLIKDAQKTEQSATKAKGKKVAKKRKAGAA